MKQQRAQIDVRRRRVHGTNPCSELQRRLDEPLEACGHHVVVNTVLLVRRRIHLLEGMPHKLGAATKVEDEMIVPVKHAPTDSSAHARLAGLQAVEVDTHRARTCRTSGWNAVLERCSRSRRESSAGKPDEMRHQAVREGSSLGFVRTCADRSASSARSSTGLRGFFKVQRARARALLSRCSSARL